MGLLACLIGFQLAKATFVEEHTGLDLRVLGYYMTLCNDFRNEQEVKKADAEMKEMARAVFTIY